MNDIVTLDAETVFSQLERNTGDLPEAAIRFAAERWEDTSPLFLKELRDAATDPDSILAKGDGYFRHLYAMYLAAQCRETATFSHIVDFLSHPGEVVPYLLGDVLTEDLDRIIASVCGCDLDLTKRLVENSLLDEFVRSAALESLFILFAEDKLDREYIIGYLKELFSTKVEREPNYLWCSMVNLSCDLYPEELAGEIDLAYAENLVDPSDVSPGDVAKALSLGKEKALIESRRYSKGLIDDTAAELRTWACFNRTEEGINEDPDLNQVTDRYYGYHHAGTFVRESPKIGRNSPCPCGSGKKYKKCCLN